MIHTLQNSQHSKLVFQKKKYIWIKSSARSFIFPKTCILQHKTVTAYRTLNV
jgi:hypothetical protein